MLVFFFVVFLFQIALCFPSPFLDHKQLKAQPIHLIPWVVPSQWREVLCIQRLPCNWDSLTGVQSSHPVPDTVLETADTETPKDTAPASKELCITGPLGHIHSPVSFGLKESFAPHEEGRKMPTTCSDNSLLIQNSVSQDNPTFKKPPSSALLGWMGWG